jgi:ADP-heptose:LPS heptosyltransferase
MTIRKALVFKPASLGDCLMAKYFLDNIHAFYPQAKLGIVVGSRGAMIRDLFAAYPWIEVLEVNRRKPLFILKLLVMYRGSDVVCTPYASAPVNLGTKLIARLLAKRRGLVGFTDRSRFGWLYDTVIPLEGYQTPRLLEQRALAAIGISASQEWPSFAYLPEPGVLVRFGLEQKKYIVVHLFSGSENRGLSPENRQSLINALAKADPSRTMVFTGTKKERTALQSLRLPLHSVLAAGETTIQELAQLIDLSAFVVALGSGVSHIASHLGKKSIALADCRSAVWCTQEQYGSKAPVLFTRHDLCPDGHSNVPYPPCMNGINMEMVALTAQNLIAHGNN